MANTLKNVVSSDIGTTKTTLYTVPSSTTTILIGLTMANTLANDQINVSASVVDTSAETSYVDSGVTVATITSSEWGFVDTGGGLGADLAFGVPTQSLIDDATAYMGVGDQIVLKYAADPDQTVTISSLEGSDGGIYGNFGDTYIIFNITESLNTSNSPTSFVILGDVTVTVESEGYIVKNATIAPGGALVPVGGEQKVILETGDVIKVQSSAATSLDVIASVVEQS